MNRIQDRTPGMLLLAILVFMLFAAPKANIRLGPIPIYIVDVIIVACLAKAFGLKRMRIPFGPILAVLYVLMLFSEAMGVFRSGTLLEPVYIAIRASLAFSVVFVTVQLVRSPWDIELLLKAAVAGLLVTASLMVMSSLPPTRPIANAIFGLSFLEPAARNVVELYSEFGEYGVRGRTLAGVSNLGAAYVNILWPLAALLLNWPRPIGVWRALSLAACYLAPFGVMMSYSRSAIVGTVLIVLVVLTLGLSRLRSGILRPIVTAAVLVALVGVGSQFFFFERITNRTEMILEGSIAQGSEDERVLAYIEPFEHAAEHPEFLFVGEGMGIQRSGEPFENAGTADHAVFGKAYYVRGMVSAVLYVLLIGFAYLASLRAALPGRPTFASAFAAAALLSMTAVLPWAMFAHAIISAPRASMVFFFVIGLVCVAARVTGEARRAASRPAVPQVHADRHNPAL